jgi:O-antigen/teichoic acid export membrane protein
MDGRVSRTGRKTRAARGLAATLLSASTGLLSTLILIPVALHYLGPESYGRWTIMFQVVGFAGLLDLGISYAVTRDLAAARAGQPIDQQRRLLASGFVLYLALASILILCGVLLMPVVTSIVSESEIRNTWMLLMLFAAAAFPVRFIGAANVGAQAIAPASIVGFVQGVTNVLLAVVLLRQGIGIEALALALVVSEALALVLQLAVFQRHVGLSSLDPRGFRFRSATKLLGFSLQVFVTGLSWTIVWSMDPLIVGAALGATAVTMYTVSARVPAQLVALVNLGADVSMPGFTDIHTKESVAERRSAYVRLGQLVGLASGFCAAGVIVFLRPFVDVWVGVGYRPSVPVVLALAYLVIHHPIQHACAVVLVSARAIRTFAWVSAVEATINVALSLILVRPLGILGVLIATILAGLIDLSYVLWKSARIGGMSTLDATVPPFSVAAFACITGVVAELAVSWVDWTTSWRGLFVHGAVWSVISIALFLVTDATLTRGRVRWLVTDVLRALAVREEER